jgi:LPXTG-motif cell wall-anchored protein
MTTQQNPGQYRVVSKLFTTLFILGFALIATGIMLTLIATILSSSTSTSSNGMIIFIGPIPIAFGTGPSATLTLILAAIFTALMLLAFLVMRRRTEKID